MAISEVWCASTTSTPVQRLQRRAAMNSGERLQFRIILESYNIYLVSFLFLSKTAPQQSSNIVLIVEAEASP